LDFEGDYFLNACLIIETELKPTKAMRELLAIEKALGRTRTKKKGYESRTIDFRHYLFWRGSIGLQNLKITAPRNA